MLCSLSYLFETFTEIGFHMDNTVMPA